MNFLMLNTSRLAASKVLCQGFAQKAPAPSIVFKSMPLSYKPIQFTCTLYAKRCYSTVAPININVTNLTKDVIVYKYNNSRHFRYLSIFSIAQFVFLTAMAEFTVNNLRNTPVDEKSEDFSERPFYEKQNLGADRFRYGLGGFLSFMAVGILAVSWMYTLKSVRYLILRKGGKKVSFVTYGPLGRNRIMDVPLNCVTAVQSRTHNTSYLPLRVKGKYFYYILNKAGEYTQPEIFDHVINVKRNILAPSRFG